MSKPATALRVRFAALLAAVLLVALGFGMMPSAFADPDEDTAGATASSGSVNANIDEGITILPSGVTLDPEMSGSAGTVLMEGSEEFTEPSGIADGTTNASGTAADSATGASEDTVPANDIATAFAAAIEAARANGAVTETGDSPAMSGDDATADASSSGAVDAQGASDAAENAENSEGSDAADPSAAAETTKPYSTLTPVEGEGNTVNTHQLPDSSFLYDTSLTELASATSYYDGQTVQITGEVIGDILKDGLSGTHVWVTLASTSATSDATIMIYLPVSSVSIIDTLGAYGTTGTILQVRGTYHLVCSDHEGISDIHVENVNVVSPGASSPDIFSWAAFRPGILLVVLAGVLALVLHFIRQRLR